MLSEYVFLILIFSSFDERPNWAWHGQKGNGQAEKSRSADYYILGLRRVLTGASQNKIWSIFTVCDYIALYYTIKR